MAKTFLEKFNTLFPEFEKEYPNDVSDYSMMKRYIQDSRIQFDGEEIVAALTKGKQDKLLAKAQRAVQIDDLWVETLPPGFSPDNRWSDNLRKKGKGQGRE